MPLVQMRELQVAARGKRVTPGAPMDDIPGHILGMVTCVRWAIHKVHTDSPAEGREYIGRALEKWLARAGSDNRGERASATAASNYIDCVHQAAAWHVASGAKLRRWEVPGLVTYSDTDHVQAIVRAVVENREGGIEGRVILWDSAPLDLSAAEVIAAPAIEVLDQLYEGPIAVAIEVWQCREQVLHRVEGADARTARPRAAALVAAM